MTLDLSDCTITGPALPMAFLRDGLTLMPHSSPSLRTPPAIGGAEHVHRAILVPAAAALGYSKPVRQASIATREGDEDGGWLLRAGPVQLRTWSLPPGTDLDAGARRSPTRCAQRVLFTLKEPAGLITNGHALRLLLSDPERADSTLTVAPDSEDGWRILATLLAAPRLPGLRAVLDQARLHQAKVNASIRLQAREAITGFINALPDRDGIPAEALWHEALILVYRLLFILKLESASDPGFSFAASALWRSALSPNQALGPLVRRHLDLGQDTGRMLEDGLRALFSLFQDGARTAALSVAPLGGFLFGPQSLRHLASRRWGDRAVALLLDRLMWLPGNPRARVHYGSLGVEDLGGIYETLLEQEPVLAPDNTFTLTLGPGRKSSGAYYTPHEFVRFLVRETLDPRIAALSPPDDPNPAALLRLTIVDPAVGSGHFLVEACRHLGDAVLTAARQADALGLTDRIDALPDPDAMLAAYLPSRGDHEVMARAICRRLVAVHCLFGCDRNKLAVELTKLSLWLESWAEGLPLTFLDHRIVHGDALTGPFFEDMLTLPVTGGPLDPLLARDITAGMQARVAQARDLVGRLNASIGRDLQDLDAKQQTKRELDTLLAPLRQLAQAWTQAVMQPSRDADDRYLVLARDTLSDTPVAETSGHGDAPPLAWDLTFPDIFAAGGFSIVLGNPPWEVMAPNSVDFISDYDPSIRQAKTAQARAAIQRRVLADPAVAERFAVYLDGFERMKRVAPRLFKLLRASAGNLDLFRLFAERALRLAGSKGGIGMVLPSAFHANASTSGLRRHYLEATRIGWCLSFENRNRWFDIDSRFKFDLIVANRPGPTQALRCGFYLHRIADIDAPGRIMRYTRRFLRQAGGTSLTPPELRGNGDQRVAERLYGNAKRLGAWCERRGIRFGNDLHMTGDSGLFLPPNQGDLVMHEGKTFHQFTSVWDSLPRYSVASGTLPAGVAEAASHIRLVFRDIARSNDDRTMIACLAPPGTVFGHTATVEKTPWTRRPDDAALLCAVFNSFPFDWLIRLKAATHLSLYLLQDIPMPGFTQAEAEFLSAAAQDRPPPALRAEMDVVIARAYGLDWTAYARILDGFAHRAWPDAPMACRAAWDALAAGSSRELAECVA